jgi:hypothetical protein
MARAQTKEQRIYVRANDAEQAVFRAVADSLGLSNMSEAIRFVMFEKARQLGVEPNAKRRK